MVLAGVRIGAGKVFVGVAGTVAVGVERGVTGKGGIEAMGRFPEIGNMIAVDVFEDGEHRNRGQPAGGDARDVGDAHPVIAGVGQLDVGDGPEAGGLVDEDVGYDAAIAAPTVAHRQRADGCCAEDDRLADHRGLADRVQGDGGPGEDGEVGGVAGGGTVVVNSTVGGFPRGINPSDDANGFIFQAWIGRRNARAPEYLPNQAPVVTLTAGEPSVMLACDPGYISQCELSSDQVVGLVANASDPDGDTLLYTYTSTGGRITGDGANVSWDLSGAQPGTYTATVEVDDGCGCVTFSSTTVTIEKCTRCVPPCPTLSVNCPTDLVEVGQPINFSANVSGGDPNASITYNWTVSSGTISSGQGSSSITVDTTGLNGGGSVTATVELGGVAPECNRTASCTTNLVQNVCRKFDEYGNIAFNDEKARLDNFAIELQNTPGSTGYIIAYGGRRARVNEAQSRADRAKAYLVNTRQIDSGRIVTVDGGHREDLTVELWICPVGAPTPAATPTVDASEVIMIKGRGKTRRPRRTGGRGGR